jgi:glycosyltransferase involved in cell wall biosynthesis
MEPQQDPSAEGAAAPPETLLAISQVAGPLLYELLTDLSAVGVRCTLLAGSVECPEGGILAFRVLRGRKLTKAPAWKRLWSWAVFTFQAIAAAARARSPVLVTTNPPWPMLVMPLLRRLLGVRFVLLVYDVYPDVMERMGLLRSHGPVAALWRSLSGRALGDADGAITLGPRMAETLRGHLRTGRRCDIEVIPNWADTQRIRPLEKAQNPFARRHGLEGKLVVMYSGAFGATHDVESIVAAAEMVGDLGDVHFMLVGGGTREKEVARLVERKALANLTLLPLQPAEVFPQSIASADCAIVCLDEGYEGVSVPSKTYSAMAAGTALLAVSGPDTELTDVIESHGCGVHIPPRRPDLLAGAVRRFHRDRAFLQQCKRAARAAAEAGFSRRRATEHYRRYLSRRLAARRRGHRL